jgi:hypothetical protein
MLRRFVGIVDPREPGDLAPPRVPVEHGGLASRSSAVRASWGMRETSSSRSSSSRYIISPKGSTPTPCSGRRRSASSWASYGPWNGLPAESEPGLA